MPPVRTLTPWPAPSSSEATACAPSTVRCWRSRNDLGLRDPQRDRLARDHVLERAALLTGEHRGVDLLGVLRPAQDHPAAGAAERLVDRRGHDVGIGHRVGVQAGGDQPREVRHVDHQQGADLVGDLAEAGEVEPARVGRPAREQELRAPLARDPRHLVHVDQARLAIDLVGDDVVEPARHVDLHAVAEMAAMGEREAHDACRPARAGRGRRRCWPARRRAAGRWRARRRRAPWRGRSPAARRRRRTRSRRSSGARGSPRRTCWSARCPGTRAPPGARSSRWRSSPACAAGGPARIAGPRRPRGRRRPGAG